MASPGIDSSGDGVHKHTYDAWNRLAKVERAWRDDANGALQTGSVVARIEYDGLNRRTRKMIDNCGDWDCTYRYTWDRNWRLLKTRNGSGQTLKQHVWGPRYVDEIVQLAVNTDPSADSNCEALCYPLQNANFNVLGLADANGVLVERYEYTPYGQRSVYKKAGTNDALTSAPLDHSQRVEGASGPQPYTLCDLGHQGLRRDKEFGMYDVRTRPWPPLLGRWAVRDYGGGYVDGMSLYQYVRGNPVPHRDPKGLSAKASKPGWKKGCCVLKTVSEGGPKPLTPADEGVARLREEVWKKQFEDQLYDSSKPGDLERRCKCWEASWSHLFVFKEEKQLLRVESNPCDCGIRAILASTKWKAGKGLLDLLDGNCLDDIGHSWIESPMGKFAWSGGTTPDQVVGWIPGVPADMEYPVFRSPHSLMLLYGPGKKCSDATCQDIGHCLRESAKEYAKTHAWAAPSGPPYSPDPWLTFGYTCSDFVKSILRSWCMDVGALRPLSKSK